MEQLVAIRLGSKDIHTLSYIHPSLGSNDFWMRKLYAAYSIKPEDGYNYMLEYETIEKLSGEKVYVYLLKRKYITLLKRLINYNNEKELPLIRAAEYGNLEIVKYALKQGAEIHIWNEAALRYAAGNGHLEVVKYLVEQGADIHVWDDAALQLAALEGHLEVVKYLVEKGADIHAENDEPLRYAASKGHLEVVKYLVEQGADIYAHGNFILLYAASHGNLEIVKYLVEKGADIHTRDDVALNQAASSGHVEVVRYLLEQGANMHAKNDQALRHAAQNGHLEVVKHLVEKGADLETLKRGLRLQKYSPAVNKYCEEQIAFKVINKLPEKCRCAATTFRGEQCRQSAAVGKYCNIHSHREGIVSNIKGKNEYNTSGSKT